MFQQLFFRLFSNHDWLENRQIRRAGQLNNDLYFSSGLVSLFINETKIKILKTIPGYQLLHFSRAHNYMIKWKYYFGFFSPSMPKIIVVEVRMCTFELFGSGSWSCWHLSLPFILISQRTQIDLFQIYVFTRIHGEVYLSVLLVFKVGSPLWTTIATKVKKVIKKDLINLTRCRSLRIFKLAMCLFSVEVGERSISSRDCVSAEITLSEVRMPTNCS